MGGVSMPSQGVPQAALASPARDAGLAHLPLPLFALPMGVGGLGLAWREAARVLTAPAVVGEVLLGLAVLFWLLIVCLHLLRFIRHPAAFAADLKHPVRSAFTGAITIGLMIASAAVTPYWANLARAVWTVAVLGHLAIALWTVRDLLVSPRDPSTLTPPLLIPLVGNILAPVFGIKLGFETASVLMFGLGAALWLFLQPLLLLRLMSAPALPAKLRPTLAILLAPPAVGALAVAELMGGFGSVPLAMFGFAAFVALLLALLARDLVRAPFALSAWAWTFPVAAFTVACLAAANAHPAAWHAPALWALLALASAIVAIVLVGTARLVSTGALLAPEG